MRSPAWSLPTSRRAAAGALLLAGVALASARPAGAQAPPPAALAAPSTLLVGVVVDATGRPIAGVQILLLEVAATAVTDSAGAFAFAGAPEGWYTLVARRIGYQPASFDIETRGGATTRVRYRLLGGGHVLDTVHVAGVSSRSRLRDFEHRRTRALSGTFFTRADLDRYDPRVLTDLLRRAAGVRIDDSGLEQSVMARRSVGTLVVASDGTMEARPCPFRLALDGRLLPAGTSLNLVAPGDIAGVEVYPGPASIPLEFVRTGPDAVCGLVVVWTR